MGDSDGRTITRPKVQTPVIENFIENKPGELFLVDCEWMFDLHSIPVAPGISLRFPPPAFKPISIRDGEFANGITKSRAQRQSVFTLMPAVRRPRLAMKIEGVNRKVLVRPEHPTHAIAEVGYLG